MGKSRKEKKEKSEVTRGKGEQDLGPMKAFYISVTSKGGATGEGGTKGSMGRIGLRKIWEGGDSRSSQREKDRSFDHGVKKGQSSKKEGGGENKRY